ncbi:MAG: anti-sigma factor domain-containing protein [Tepidiformaceae bacterium]
MTADHLSQEQADEYAIGALEEAADRAVSLHLLECDPCRDLVTSAQLVAASLALGSSIGAPPRSMRRRVFESTGISRPSLLSRATRFGAAAAVVAAIVVASAALTGMISLRAQVDDLKDANGLLDSRVREAISTKVEVAALTAKLDEAEQASAELLNDNRLDKEILLALMSDQTQVVGVISTSDSSSTLGRLIWDGETNTLWFVATGLERLGNGQVYQIWLNAGGSYVSVGTFNADDTGFARYTAPIAEGLNDYDGAVVTVEQASSTPIREGPPVFVMDLTKLR